MNKIEARKRRAAKTKARLKNSERPRLVVFRSASHIYSQIVVPTDKGDKVLAAANSLDKEIKAMKAKNKCEVAQQVGQLLGKRAKEQNLSQVAFDRSGYQFHGRVASLANAAREAGLDF